MFSRNVRLTFLDTSPYEEVERLYGGFRGLWTTLREEVLLLEGHLKEGQAFPHQDLVQLEGNLSFLKRYSALGPRGNEEAAESFCEFVPPLTRLVKVLLRETERPSAFDTSYNSTIDSLLTLTSQCMSNCADGVTRRSPDTLFEIAGGLRQLDSRCESCRDVDSVCVCVGYDDYCSGETGARLWAGEVGLSLYLTENFHALLLPHLAKEPERCCRLVEVGCGTGLASLTLAQLLLLHTAATPALTDASPARRAELLVTDVSPSVVEEVRRSFAERNGPLFARLLGGEAETVTVTPTTLDMKDVPPHLQRTFHFAYAGDIVYDHTIAPFILPCFSSLLLSGGTAILCCEAHRDGMKQFCASIKSAWADVFDVVCMTELDKALVELEMIHSLTQSHCILIVLTRK